MAEYPDLDDIFRLQWASQGSSQCYSQLPGTVTSHEGSELPSPRPDSVVPRGRPNVTSQITSQNPSSHEEKLAFVEEKDWEPQKKYDADCLHYLIEWKARLNRKAFANQSEPNVVVSLGCYWRLVLQDRLEDVVRRRFPGRRQGRLDHVVVVVSVTERSQRPITKEFEVDQIDWTFADTQLIEWSPYFQKGKRLRVNLSFNYVEDNPESTSRAARRGDKRGRTSASSRMRAERVRQIEIEREVTGVDPIWPDVYAFMRCQKQSCESAPHCWVDSAGKHYKMNPIHLRRLVEHVAQNGTLETHNDVPLDLQHQLIAEDKEGRDRRAKQASNSGPGMPSINITNVLPSHPQHTLETGGELGYATPGRLADAAKLQQMEFYGLRDDALREYAKWQQSRVRDASVKAEFAKAFDVALKKRLFLELMYENPNPRIFIEEGVPEGVAWYFCRGKDIEDFWNENMHLKLGVGESGI